MPAPGQPTRRRLRLLTPSRWPVRWRLAGVSAVLTFVILLTFAAVVGKLSQERLENDFRNELQAAANRIAFTIEINTETGEVSVPIDELRLSDEVVRVTPAVGDAKFNVDVPLPSPRPGEIVRTGELDVATAQVNTTLVGAGITFVQVARDHNELDATIGRLWLFLAVGVAGGSILATLAGLAVAGRAMGPIADLTTTAREIATTRDPARTMPKPEADDEVAELATTLDEMLRELDAARNEAQGMVNAQREFVADASHELRTPLTSILANLELLQASLEQNPTEGEEAEMVASALRSSQRMRRLVGDLLILARADAGRQGARRPCDLAAITEAATAEIRPLAPEHTISLTAEPTGVEGNPDELHRVAINLIDNGVRHTPPGSAITVRVYQHGSEAVLEVADNGPGIPEGMVNQVFGRFVRGSGPADVTADSGAGLGLSIVRAVATAHGGSVAVGTSNHGGALFTVTLPMLSEAPADVPKKLSRVL
jgi:two-component system OmpR family sensor kinase